MWGDIIKAAKDKGRNVFGMCGCCFLLLACVFYFHLLHFSL